MTRSWELLSPCNPSSKIWCKQIVTSKELAALREEVVEEALDPNRSARSFEPIEGTKEILIDPSGSEGKVVRIGTTLSSK